MWKYIVTHWRGEQGLLRSCLLNGVALYFALSPVLAMLSGIGAYLAFNLGFLYGSLNDMENSIKFYAFFFWSPIALLVNIWACVGMVRCGLRNESDRTNNAGQRIGGVIAVLFGIATITHFVFTCMHDLVSKLEALPT